MRNQGSIFPVTIENNSISPWLATRENIKRAEDRVFVVRAGDVEIEAFVVLVPVRIVVLGVAGLLEGVAFFQRRVDVGLLVAGAAAGGDA